MSLALVLGVNKDIIQKNNDKNIEIFGQNLINVLLKLTRPFEKPKSITWYSK